jgi:hypothetical protein
MANREQDVESLSQQEVVSMLVRCCEDSVAALIFPRDTRSGCCARFAAISDESVTLAVDPECEKIGLHPLSPCILVFNHECQTVVGFSRVRELNYAKAPAELVLDLPSRVLSIESRTVFRVPVLVEHGLEVQLKAEDERTWSVTGLDVSAGGMLIEFPPGSDPDLAIDTQIGVELRLEDKTATATGIVRHHHGSRYGLFFAESLQQGELIPEQGLRGLLSTLETRWLQHRVR